MSSISINSATKHNVKGSGVGKSKTNGIKKNPISGIGRSAGAATKGKKKIPSSTIGKAGLVGTGKSGLGGRIKKASPAARSRSGIAPSLLPSRFATGTATAPATPIPTDDVELTTQVKDLLNLTLGADPSPFSANGVGGSSNRASLSPRSSSTTKDRGQAAADLAVLAGVPGRSIFVIKRCGVLHTLERMLGALPTENTDNDNTGGGMSRINSVASMASIGSVGTGASGATGDFDGAASVKAMDKDRRNTPPEGREGCLLLLRALIEISGPPVEPFVVPLLAAALRQCSSSNSSVREAAEDTTASIVRRVHFGALSCIVVPMLLERASNLSEGWRTKAAALERLTEISLRLPTHVCPLLPTIMPALSPVVFDTKREVTDSCARALHACCASNSNPDLKPALDSIVSAIIQPRVKTGNAIDQLHATTFVSPVDSSSLAILCPVLARGLRGEGMLESSTNASDGKRKCCVVVENMSRLVIDPESVGPFGPLLVPEMKKVAENVAFEGTRDAALSALDALTKALGSKKIGSSEDTSSSANASGVDAPSTTDTTSMTTASTVSPSIASLTARTNTASDFLEAESKRVSLERKRIEDARLAEEALQEETERREREERKLWKEAMEAQRQLDNLKLQEDDEEKRQKAVRKEMEKKSTKEAGGKCRGCGLKKCKKTCLFNSA